MAGLRFEAETMILQGYRRGWRAVASGGQDITLSGQDSNETGSASFTFTGPSATYSIDVSYFDEADGTSQFQLFHNGQQIDNWLADQNLGSNVANEQTLTQRFIPQSLVINTGDTFEIRGAESRGEGARFDFIEFTPTQGSTPTPDPSPAPTPEPVPVPAPEPTSTLRVEAESMTLQGYRRGWRAAASGGRDITLSGREANEMGSASFTFTGPSATYSIDVSYFDEADGTSQFQLLHNGQQIDSWLADQNLGSNVANEQTLTQRSIPQSLVINTGDTFEIRGSENRGEGARFDFIEFTPMQGSTPTPDPVPEPEPIPEPEPEPTPEPMPTSTFRVEAESMTLQGYRRGWRAAASGGRDITLSGQEANEMGSASFTFSGESATYGIDVSYFDEADGISRFQLFHNGQQIDNWFADQNLGSNVANAQTLTQRSITQSLVINTGDTFEIRGFESQGEGARFDFIEFTSAQGSNSNPPPPPNPGGTASFSQAQNGVVVSLDTNTALLPIFDPTDIPTIMPLGDSITAGFNPEVDFFGGYRIPLSQSLINDGFTVDFVGTLSSGPESLIDQDHEGHGGRRIAQVKDIVTPETISALQPDFILLKLGTNDVSLRAMGGRTVAQMLDDMEQLIDAIAQFSPETEILVSSIVPRDPAVLGINVDQVQRANEFNQRLPGLISDKATQGRQVRFIDAGGRLSLSDISFDGIHPNVAGDQKLAEAWYEALVSRERLNGESNITGSNFNDVLTGNSLSNSIRGLAGNDTLTGQGGADTFVFDGPNQGGDVITDFTDADQLQFSASGFGGGLQSGVALSTEVAATGVLIVGSAPSPVGASSNFLYNTTNSLLSFDRDGAGTGAAITVARLSGAPTLNLDQISIVA